MTYRTPTLAACLAAITALVVARPVRAQAVEIQPTKSFENVVTGGASPACLARIPDAELEPIEEFLSVAPPSGARWDRAMASFWSAIGGDVAELMRGAATATTADGRPQLAWQLASGRVQVTAFRDGRVRWKVEDAVPTAGDSLMLGALTSSVGGGLPAWPDTTVDSSVVALGFEGVGITRTPKLYESPYGVMVPAFATRRPVLVEAEMASNESPAGYPERLRKLGVQGSVALSFIVDTLGRADPETFDTVVGTDEEFTAAALDAVRRARFEPAVRGGRRVRMVVQVPFFFVFAGAQR